MRNRRTTRPVVGRHALLDALRTALRSEHLVSLVGPGGVGKTRLASFLADELDGLSVDLSRTSDVPGVLDAMAAALGDGPGSSPSARVAASVLEHHGLLVLEDAEQARAALTELLPTWFHAGVRFLVTSRLPMEMAGERVVEVSPLALPTPGLSSAGLRNTPAIQCFVEAAPQGAITDEDLPLVVEIVTALDGLPLALELAAARLQIITLTDLHERMSGLTSLIADPNQPEGRRGSLAAMLSSSWSMLDDVDRAALVQAAIFTGDFRVSDAEAVIHLPGGKSVLDALHRLRRHHLVTVRSPGRLGLLNTIRAFVREQSVGDFASAGHLRLVAHAQSVASAAFGALLKGDLDVLDVLSREAEWLVAASRLATAQGDRVRALEIAMPICTLWSARGPYSRVVTLLDHIMGEDLPSSSTLVWALRARGFALRHLSLLDRAEADLRRMVETAEGLSDDGLVCHAHANLGDLHYVRAELPAAERAYRRAMDHAKRADMREMLGTILSNLARILALDERFDEAEALCRDALLHVRAAQDLEREALVLESLGTVLNRAQRFDEALEPLDRACDLFAELEFSRRRAVVLSQLGISNDHLERLDRARDLYTQSLAIMNDLGDRRFCAIVSGHLGRLLLTIGALPAARAQLTVAVASRSNPAGEQWEAWLAIADALSGSVGAARRRQKALDPRFSEGTWRVAFDLADGLLLAGKGRRTEAITAARRATTTFSALRDGCPVHARRFVETWSERLTDCLGGWRVATDGTWFETPDGEWVSLENRSHPGRMLAALATRNVETPGLGHTIEELVAIGWPGERLVPSSARNRVRVAVSTLRKAGLSLLERRDEVYLLAEDQLVVLQQPRSL